MVFRRVELAGRMKKRQRWRNIAKVTKRTTRKPVLGNHGPARPGPRDRHTKAGLHQASYGAASDFNSTEPAIT